ncbi:MAG: biotin--[acetyl-CoA-carboxylase] ligase [Bacteroidales bacterium]|jgi:BirA family biotin operon repressor/biotin-[acetyl-CoA-carboxylase] ligase
MKKATNIVWFDSIDSTNNQLFTDKKELPDKSVYAAVFQTAGRGQRGNSWNSSAGENLTFSILFKPTQLSSNNQFIVSQVVTLGIINYLRTKGVEAKIKWPNDIYVGNLKICGILIENTISSDKLTHSVAGIGLNLNQNFFNTTAANPTSLTILTGEKYNIKEELDILLDNIFNYYDSLTVEKYDEIKKKYLENLYRIGEYHNFIEIADNKTINARIIGINKAACIVLEHSDGLIRSYAFKELKYII